ncbi:hypothetical protein RISK_005436 [Rhodopirellula islandica]|uniref:Uncharacterized protein n=1 Tax=Rhodopirellula islandica TaxID=595434 RepID=A0A0J1B6C6_RHOIS|nr:hypothetical protein RISK_005436 [Rhodopirellula islandica]
MDSRDSATKVELSVTRCESPWREKQATWYKRFLVAMCSSLLMLFIGSADGRQCPPLPCGLGSHVHSRTHFPLA